MLRPCALFSLLLVFGISLSGCGYPTAQPENMELITALRTACSARNAEWLTATERKVEEQRTAGEMGDSEYASFQAIIEQAREGDWAGAERAALKFQKAQRPTAEQAEKMRQFHEGS